MKPKDYLWTRYWQLVKQTYGLSAKIRLIDLMVSYLDQEYNRRKAMVIKYAKKNPEVIRTAIRNWNIRNREKLRVKAKETRKLSSFKEWYRQYDKNRRRTDPQYRLRKNVRLAIFGALKSARACKEANTLELIGCSVDQLKIHLESHWLSGMSWDNYGMWKVGQPMTWHVDHIKPCASFDLTDQTQQRACFHWTNLQPLWAIDNMHKRDKVTWVRPQPPCIE